MTSEGKLYFARRGADVFVRLEGRGTHALGSDFDHFIASLCAKGDFAEIVVDLTAATALDSTMLGLVARIAKWMRQNRGSAATLLCSGDKIPETVRGVGLDRLVNLIDQPLGESESMSPIPSIETTRTEKAQAIVAAHRELMALNDKNASQFRSVVEFLERDLDGSR